MTKKQKLLDFIKSGPGLGTQRWEACYRFYKTISTQNLAVQGTHGAFFDMTAPGAADKFNYHILQNRLGAAMKSLVAQGKVRKISRGLYQAM